MIDLTPKNSSGAPPDVSVRLIGIGNAGSNTIDRILLDGLEKAEAMIMNTDQQELTRSVVPNQLQLGSNVTHGLGAGGDPEMGLDAARESVEEIRAAIEDCGMVILSAGLGGGTGSGGAPVVARVAKDAGALVIVFATMPFNFEGRRRRKQAEESLEALRQIADVVICFENDRMGENVSSRAGAHQAFAAADQTISQSVRAVCGLLHKRGLVRIGFDELRSALGTLPAPAVFGFGQAEGENRAHEALEKALKSPLMDRGKLIEKAHNLLVSVSGGPDMTLAEVQVMMDALNRFVGEDTQILFGLQVDGGMGQAMSITILCALSLGGGARQLLRPQEFYTPVPPAAAEISQVETHVTEDLEPAAPEGEASPFYDEPAVDEDVVLPEAVEEPAAPTEPEEPVPAEAPETFFEEEAPSVSNVKKPSETQETLQFEPVNRGRFEKSEPTIVNGEDLDVPTFLRRNVRIK